MGTAGPRIGFICMAGPHLSSNGKPVDHLTIHQSEWAYCPMDARTHGHEWKSTGGATLAELEIVVKGLRERLASDVRTEARANER